MARTSRVGFLTAYSSRAEANCLRVVFDGVLRELGYEEGRNVLYEARWAEGKLEHLPGLATELVAAQGWTSWPWPTRHRWRPRNEPPRLSPSCMMLVGDPVATGLVDSLARPGGNITGLSPAVGELTAKRLELLKQAVPRLSRVAALGQPGDPVFAVQMRHVEGRGSVAESRGVPGGAPRRPRARPRVRNDRQAARRRGTQVLGRRPSSRQAASGRSSWRRSTGCRWSRSKQETRRPGFSWRMRPIEPRRLTKPQPM